MSTITEIIERVDDCKPNAFTQKVKLAWIAELDGKIATEVLLLSIADAAQLRYRYPADMENTPLLDFPYDAIYDAWLSAKIDFANGEYDKYQNSMEFYNASLNDFVRWLARNCDPVQGYATGGFNGKENPPYYLSTYALAVKRGFTGTLDEWLASIKGDKGDKGDPGYELTEQDKQEIAALATPDMRDYPKISEGMPTAWSSFAGGFTAQQWLSTSILKISKENYPGNILLKQGVWPEVKNVPQLQLQEDLSGGDVEIVGIGNPTQKNSAVNRGYAEETFFPKTGGTLTGPVSVEKATVTSILLAIANDLSKTVQLSVSYDTEGMRYIVNLADVQTGLPVSITGLSEPVNREDAPNKGYTDNKILEAIGDLVKGNIVLTEGVHYGTELPEPGVTGRLFFKVVG